MAEYADRGGNRTKPNYFYAIISVTLVLFLLGFFGVILIQAQHLVVAFKERVNLLVELKENVAEEEVEELRQLLRQSMFTKAESVSYVSREEAAEIMRRDFGEDFLKLDLPNPFYDVVTFNVRAEYMQPDSLTAIRDFLRGQSSVNDVYYQESLIDEIAGNVRRLGLGALIIGLLFLLVAATLIHNTIRLALYANRFLIKNMELVGASWEFISRPYLVRAVLHGMLSGILAVTALLGLLYWMQSSLPEIRSLQNGLSLALLFAGLVVLGILITTLSTYYVVHKYLKMRVDDLY